MYFNRQINLSCFNLFSFIIDNHIFNILIINIDVINRGERNGLASKIIWEARGRLWRIGISLWTHWRRCPREKCSNWADNWQTAWCPEWIKAQVQNLPEALNAIKAPTEHRWCNERWQTNPIFETSWNGVCEAWWAPLLRPYAK